MSDKKKPGGPTPTAVPIEDPRAFPDEPYPAVPAVKDIPVPDSVAVGKDNPPRTAESGKAAKTKVSDPEIVALNKINALMAGLDGEQRFRVLSWAMNRYAMKTSWRGVVALPADPREGIIAAGD